MNDFHVCDGQKETRIFPLKTNQTWCFFPDLPAFREIMKLVCSVAFFANSDHEFVKIMNFDSPSDMIGRVEKQTAKNTKPVSFFHLDGTASKVSVVGDFNNWDANANPMEKRIDGSWNAIVQLPNGHHKYMLNVDGQIIEDPKAHGIVRDDQGKRVCMIAVSGF